MSAAATVGEAIAMSNTGKPELIFDPDTKTYGIMVDHVEVISGLDPVGLRNGTARSPEPRSIYEQPIWDEVVRIMLGHGADPSAAAHGADTIIAQRRKHGAP